MSSAVLMRGLKGQPWPPRPLSQCRSITVTLCVCLFLTSPPMLFPPSDDLPAVSSVSATPASPKAISLAWVNPSSDCYQFSSRSVSCNSTDNDDVPLVTPVWIALMEGLYSAKVTGLAVDTAFTCVVLSTVSDAAGGEFPTMSSSITTDSFTYPDCEL